MKLEISPYCCDVCKKRRSDDVNKLFWFVMRHFGKHMVVCKWEDVEAEVVNSAHACGQKHAIALVQRWAAYGNFKEVQDK